MNEVNRVFLLGIGGIGMSALARYFNSIGKAVCGYDKTPSPLTDNLLLEGMEIFFEDDMDRIPDSFLDKGTLFIYTPAIKSDNSIYQAIISNGYKWFKRSELLGIISKDCFTIAVAGTHGKTTTSSMIAYLLNEGGVNFTAFLGGIASNFNSNYVRRVSEDGASQEVMVVEADEFDRSFLHLSPNISIITSMDADHLDIYGTEESLRESFLEFLNKTEGGGVKIIQRDLEVPKEEGLLFYGKNADASYVIKGEGTFSFDYTLKDLTLENMECGLPGIHNLENAVAAITAVLPLVEDKEALREALYSFKGVKRRFEIVYKSSTAVIIDDYAHHPTELLSFIESVRMMYPKRKVTGVFQPHLFSRTQDFYPQFAESLSFLDECYLLPIYPAREKPMPGVKSEMIVKQMVGGAVLDKVGLLEKIEETMPEVLLIMGAGDIGLLVDGIKKLYERKEA